MAGCVDVTPVASDAGYYPFIRHVGSHELFAAAATEMGLIYET
jgi:hypothetical protein